MMRALLLLCLVGAALYGFLVVTEDALEDADSKGGVALHTQQNRSADEHLSSWGSYLPSPSQGQNPQLAASQPATLPSQEKNDPNLSEQYRAAASGNSANSSESEGLTSGSSIAPPARAQVAAVEPTTEPSAAKPPVRKSSKRNRPVADKGH
jgi:hypothetical protein